MSKPERKIQNSKETDNFNTNDLTIYYHKTQWEERHKK